MRIGDLAQRTGVPTKTIRYYEGIGILPEPDRAPNGYREYDGSAVDQLRFIRDAQATGLTLTEISSVVGMRRDGVGTCQHVIALLDRHLENLEQHIGVLHRARRQLTAITNRARRLDPADCTDPNRCQTIASRPEAGTSATIHAARFEHVRRSR